MRGAAGSPHPQLQGKPGVSAGLAAQKTEPGHGTWGLWLAPGGARPAEEEASAGRGLRGGCTWPAAALTAGGGAAPGRGTCGQAAAAASASLVWPGRTRPCPRPRPCPPLSRLFSLFSPAFPPPHAELQNGGAGDGSREPRVGQVTRMAGSGGGARLRPRPQASQAAEAGPARGRLPSRLSTLQIPALRRGSGPVVWLSRPLPRLGLEVTLYSLWHLPMSPKSALG